MFRTRLQPNIILKILFFFSGFSALIYQVVWQRVLAQEIGVDSISISFIVSIFMVSLSFGALWGGYLTRIKNTNALIKLYFFIELIIGIFGFFSDHMIRKVNQEFLFPFKDLLMFDFLINFSLLFCPICLMGMTTPIIVHLAKGSFKKIGRMVGSFYGSNLLGAAMGAFFSGVFFIEFFGIKQTITIAAFINIIISFLFLCLFRRTKNGEKVKPVSADLIKNLDSLEKDGLNFYQILSCFLLGFGTLALQMVFFRILTNFNTMDSIVFPIILFSYLILAASSQYLTGKAVDRFYSNTEKIGEFLVLLFIVGTLTLATFLCIPPNWFAKLGILIFPENVKGWLEGGNRINYFPKIHLSLIFSLFFMSPVLFFSSFLPVVVKALTPSVKLVGSTFGKILFWSTLGNMFGSYVTSIYFFESFGTIKSICLILMAFLVSIFFLSFGKNSLEISKNKKIQLLASILTFLIIIPHDYYKKFSYGKYQISEILEGKNGVVSIARCPNYITLVQMFRTESAFSLTELPNNYEFNENKLFNHKLYRTNFSDLFSFDQSFKPKRVLILGLGNGLIPRALADYPFIQDIIVVEISHEIVEGVKKTSHSDIKTIFNHPKIKIIIADGRRFVMQAIRNGEQFDLIQNRINEPWRNNGSSLYTVDFINKVKNLLTPNGYFATSPIAGFVVNSLEVFDEGIWLGLTHVYFPKNHKSCPERIVVDTGLKDYFLADRPLRSTFRVLPGLQEKRAFLDVLIFQKKFFDNYQLNTDDRPTFEYCYWERILNRYNNPRIYLEKMGLKPQRIPIFYSNSSKSINVRRG